MAPRVRAAIVASGSELVRGDRQDRNGPYLAGSLLRLGIDPVRITVVGDEPAELEAALRAGLDEDLLVVSGGLGPTHDDRTIELLAAATGRPLAVDEELASKIEARSRRAAERLGRPYADFAAGVRKQAALPAGAEWVGLVGTAPAVVVDTGTGVAVALPGPPRELQELWPRVLETGPLLDLLRRAQAPERRVLRLFGVSESAVAESLAAAGGEGDGVAVTICARDFEIHVDLFVEAGAEARGAALEAALIGANERYLFSRDERTTAELVLDLLRAQGLSLATAESCTGGLVAARLTDVPGASDVFVGSIVAYSDEVKIAQLGVPEDGARRARRSFSGGRGGVGPGRSRTARCRCGRRRDRRRRAGRRHGGQAGRPRLSARGRPRRRARGPTRLSRRPGNDSPARDGCGAPPRAPTCHTGMTDTTHLWA